MKSKVKKLVSLFVDKTFLRFFIVGCINTLFGTGIMFVFYNVFHLSYLVSTASNYFFGSILSYFLNKYFTFKNHDHSVSSLIRFIINIVFCYAVAYGAAKPLIVWLLSDASTIIQDNISMVLGLGLFVFMNYFGQRFFVFKKKDK